MSMSKELAIENIRYLAVNYVPVYGEPLAIDNIRYFNQLIDLFGHSIEDAYNKVVLDTISDMNLLGDVFGNHRYQPGVDTGESYVARLPSSEIVDHFYPEASPADRAALIEQMEGGAISNADFVLGWSHIAPTNPQPSVDQVFEAVIEYTDSAPAVPDADLAFAGITELQLDFLTGLYISAFGRAPEHEGLEFWAGHLAEKLSNGINEGEALRALSSSFYASGQHNGELSTDLGNADYVKAVYTNVLGRNFDQGGLDFWTKFLDDGQPRGEFLVHYLDAALGAAVDAQYLDARISVAKYVAQEHVSGPGKVDVNFLLTVLDGVNGEATALPVIRDIVNTYGQAPQQVSSAESLDSQFAKTFSKMAQDSPYEHWELNDDLPTVESDAILPDFGIELIGSMVHVDEFAAA